MSINITIKIYTYMMEYYTAMKKMNYCQQKYVDESNRHNAKPDTKELFDSIYMKFTHKQN